MITKTITHVRKDADGDITHVGNVSENWSESINKAIKNINNGQQYFSKGKNSLTASKVIVVDGKSGKQHLRTAPDSDSSNNLDELPQL